MSVASATYGRRETTPRWAVAALIALAVLVRGVILWTADGTLRDDPDGYRQLARSLVESGGSEFRDAWDRKAYRPPLYPLVLAATGSHRADFTLPVTLLHLMLGIVTVWLTYRLGQCWGLGNYALLAAALVACDPILLQQSRLVMTETLATFLSVVLLHSFTTAAAGSRQRAEGRGQRAEGNRQRADFHVNSSPSTVYRLPAALFAAVAGGAAVLCRPTFLPLVAVAPVLLLFTVASTRARLVAFSTYSIALTVTLTPWIVWTTTQLGVPVVTTTHGGYTLLLGNNPSFYDYLRNGRWGTVWDAGEFQRQWQATAAAIRSDADSNVAAEVRVDRAANRQAWGHMRHEPSMCIYSCLVRCGRFWGLLPHRLEDNEGAVRHAARWMVALWYTVQFILALCGVWALRARLLRFPWLWGVLLVLAFTAVHTVYWSNLRMRAPVMPVVALLAAAGAARAVRSGDES